MTNSHPYALNSLHVATVRPIHRFWEIPGVRDGLPTSEYTHSAEIAVAAIS
jgi:hypothetical protein